MVWVTLQQDGTGGNGCYSRIRHIYDTTGTITHYQSCIYTSSTKVWDEGDAAIW